MKIIICILLGYLLGSLNPAALISRLKKNSLRDKGTGNLGATNTMLIFGKKLGALVMVLDIVKGFLAVRLAVLISPEIEWLALASGLFAIIGHCFPFYMNFKGGKGLAAFAGVVLAYKPLLFVLLLVSGVMLMIIVNYSFILPYYAATVFPAYVAMTSEDLASAIFAILSSALIMIMHFGNIIKAKNGQDNKIRPYIAKVFKKKQ